MATATPFKPSDIRALFDAGMSRRRIATRLHIRWDIVTRVLTEMGYVLTPPLCNCVSCVKRREGTRRRRAAKRKPK